jgi:hypothetical protein
MVNIINAIQKALDLFFVPFNRLEPFWGMLAVSAVTGVLMLIVYKYTSNQKGITRVKDQIKAGLLEAWIYREDVPLMLKAQGSVMIANLKYMALNLKPLVVMMIPVLILLVHLNFRYGMRPLAPGEETIVKTQRETAVTADQMDEALVTPKEIEIRTKGVRIEDRGEVDWRIRVFKTGEYNLKISAGGQDYSKRLIVGDFGTRISSRAATSNLSDAFFYPGEPALPAGGVLKRIEINYPTMAPTIPGTDWRPHWLVQYFVLSLIVGFALKGPLKVDI